jgi:hypothetical protein
MRGVIFDTSVLIGLEKASSRLERFIPSHLSSGLTNGVYAPWLATGSRS